MKLFAYLGNDIPGAIPVFEKWLGRKLDGCVFFNDYRYTPTLGVSNFVWALACFKGCGRTLAPSIPLAFAQPDPDGSHTMEDVAAGKLDAHYAAMAKALAAQDPVAMIRLGWEMSGNWYMWSAYGRTAVFNAAFSRISAIFKAASPTFTIILNPAIGTDATNEFPASGVDMVGWDVYQAVGLAAGATTEPVAWNNSLKDWWGIDSMNSWHESLPKCVPEFGAGGGNIPDDGVWMADALAYFESIGVDWVGLWNAPTYSGYNGILSDGSKPNCEAAFRKVFAPATPPPAPAGVVVTNKQGATITSTPNADGSETLNLVFPKTAGVVDYIFTLETARKLGFSNGKGGLWGDLWQGNRDFTAFDWKSAGGVGQVYVAPN